MYIKIDDLHVTYVIMDDLSDVVILCHLLQLSKVIDQRSHAGREVKHTVHQLAERDLAFNIFCAVTLNFNIHGNRKVRT